VQTEHLIGNIAISWLRLNQTVHRCLDFNNGIVFAGQLPMSRFADSQAELVWISPDQLLPNVCCTCGMFTDQRVKVKHVQFQSVPKSGDVEFTLIDLISLFLGPIGWLLAAIAHSNDGKDEFKTVKQKSKIRISQCRLCAGMSRPEPLDARRTPLQVAFRTHPEFAKRFVEANSRKSEANNFPPQSG
jgi:hypothetical protein